MRSIYFTEDHDLFRQNVRRFVETEIAPHAVEWEEAGRIPRETFVRMGDEGFLGIMFPERYGGAAGDIFFGGIFLEEITRSLMGGFCAAVSVQQFMATQHIYRSGSEALKQRYLVPSIQGRKVGALAITEPGTGSDVAALRTSALRDGDAYVIDGAKTWITNGAEGDFYTVAVKTDRDAGVGGISLIVVDAGTPGVTVGKRLHKLGLHSSDTAELVFDGVRVPASNLVGEENLGFYLIMEAFQLERLAGAFLSIGSSVVCLEKTLAYMSEREAFGRRIDRFQALRHRLADLATELEAARQLTYHTAWLHERGEPAIMESSMAKLLTSELAKRISDECLQCFGGYGYSEEYPMARFYRDARAGTILAGTSEIMREIIAKIMIDGFAMPSVSDRSRTAAETSTPDAPSTDEPVAPTRPDGESAETIPDLMQSLPNRLLPEKVGDWASRFHFTFSESSHPEWTVRIDGERCTVEEGLDGTPDCVVSMSERTYLDIESGAMDPQAAFMTGRVKVSNLAQMLTFSRVFRRVRA